MNTHGIEILDRANNHAIVRAITHDFDFKFLPSEQRFLDEHLGDRRHIESAGHDFLEFLTVVSNAAPASPQGVSRADNDGVATDFRRYFPCLIQVVGHPGLRDVQPDLQHDLLENEPVFAALDGVGLGSDQLGPETLKGAGAVEFHGNIERRLSAQSRQHGIRPLPGNDLLHNLRGDRFDIGPVGKFGVGHDGRRVRVDQHDLISLLLQRLAGLDAGVVELTPLTDDDGPGADDEDFTQGWIFRHNLGGLPI